MFEIAYNLGIPVYKMMQEMPYTELLKWIDFFKSRPVGWREDYRAYMLMSSFGFKGKPEQAFTSLRQLKQEEEKRKVNDRAVPTGLFLQKMITAVNGDHEAKALFRKDDK